MITLYKRIGCFALVLVLIFCVFASPIVAPKAEAVAVTLTVAGISVIVWVLGLLGISFGTAGAMTQSAQGFYDSSSLTVKNAVDYLSTKVSPTTQLWTLIGAEAWPHVKSVVTAAWNYFNKPALATGAGSAVVADLNTLNYNGIVLTVGCASASSQSLFNSAPYSFSDVTSLFVNGIDYSYCFSSNSPVFLNPLMLKSDDFLDNCNAYSSYLVSGLLRLNLVEGSLAWSNIELRYGFGIVESGEISYLQPYIVARGTFEGNLLYKSLFFDFPIHYGSIVVNSDDLLHDLTNIPYGLEVGFQLNQLLLELQKILTAVGSIDIPMDIPWEYTEEGKREEAGEKDEDKPLVYAPTWWMDLWDSLGLGEKVDVADPPHGGGNIDPDNYKAPVGLQYKFPFCIPFDLIALVGALNAEPVAPRWVFPIRFDSVNFSYDVVLDLSKYEQLAVPLRWGITLMFLLGLILITRKVIKG